MGFAGLLLLGRSRSFRVFGFPEVLAPAVGFHELIMMTGLDRP